MFIGAEKMEDVTEEKIRAELSKAQAQAPTQWARRSSRSADKEELVVSHLQYMMRPSEGDRDFNVRMVIVEQSKECAFFFLQRVYSFRFKFLKMMQCSSYRAQTTEKLMLQWR